MEDERVLCLKSPSTTFDKSSTITMAMRIFFITASFLMVPRPRIELGTHGFSVRRSTC